MRRREGNRKGTAYSKSMLEALKGTAGAVAIGLGVSGRQCSEGNGRQSRGPRREGIVPKRRAQCGMGGNRRYRAGCGWRHTLTLDSKGKPQ